MKHFFVCTSYNYERGKQCYSTSFDLFKEEGKLRLMCEECHQLYDLGYKKVSSKKPGL